MTGLCTRCQKPLGKVAKKVDGKLYHEDCWREEVQCLAAYDCGCKVISKPSAGITDIVYCETHRQAPKLLAHRDRLLAALKFMRRTMYSDTSEESIMADEAIRLAEEE